MFMFMFIFRSIWYRIWNRIRMTIDNRQQIDSIQQMSSYIIAGSADSLDTAYCQQIARRIKAKYKNIDFRVVIKHPSEWQEYLNQICRIYGFLKKSNPIIYTYHGKIIGNKDAFITNTAKYFGLSEQSLIVPNLSTAVNIKLANQELQRKNAIKNNTKSLTQRIVQTYQRLLKEGILKHQYKAKAEFLINGIEYYFREVPGLCPPITFQKNLNVTLENQNVEASNINLMELSLQDQIDIPAPDGGKQTIITNPNQVLNTESMERMSEASKTKKLESSVISKDEDSKINRESNQQKQKIVEQFDDVLDYNNVNMEPTFICELGDHFCLAFQTKSHVSGEMVLYHNEAQNNGSMLRVYNDRPVIGHHTLIKEIHYIGKEVQQPAGLEENSNKFIPNQEEEEQEQKQQQESPKKQQHPIPPPSEKSKTEPAVSVAQVKQKIPSLQQEALSQPCSDLNLISNLNYHTLYILKPLSSLQLRYLLYLLKETNTIACLQFLPENPNPKIKVYKRLMLLDSANGQFPIENFIDKQLQDGQFEKVMLPRDQEQLGEKPQVQVLKIKQIGFNHIYYPHPDKMTEQDLAKVLKYGIDEMLFLEQKLKKYIGYNLIISKKKTLIVALTEPYRVYGENLLYFDGLAYLGYVQTAKVIEGYKLNENQDRINDGASIRASLARCSGYHQTE